MSLVCKSVCMYVDVSVCVSVLFMSLVCKSVCM